MLCSACGAETAQGARFCGACGAALAVACLVCGARAPPGARFCAQCGTRLVHAQPPASDHSAAERRPVCVMFCDLVNFTALATRLDPEDLGQVIRSYQSRVAECVTRFHGSVTRYVGDGVLAYFGWPEAHEADAELAVRAGLAITAAVGETLICGEALHVRIGIATGVVLMGAQFGDGEDRQHTAIGETPNVAARLQGLAGSDGVVIDTATRQQIGDLFECRDLGPVELKGLCKPIPAWQVMREIAVENRFAALHAMHATPLVARHEELELLARRWRQAKVGDGQVTLVVGEAGIGKSRLLAEFEQRLNGEPPMTLRLSCLPHHRNSALHPLIARWEREFGFAHGDTATQRLRKLEATLAILQTPPYDVALIAELMSVRADHRDHRRELSPLQHKEKIFRAVNRWLINRAQGQPLFVVIEDLHWADPTTLELLDTTIGLIEAVPVLLVASSRLEFQAPWASHPAVSVIMLRRLGTRHAARLVEGITQGQPLPAAFVEQIIARADGIPLFIEELARMIVENVDQAHHAKLTVPATLQASLLARLDSLPAGKPIAQIGACIGREFSWALLEQTAGLAHPALAEGLDQLLRSGLLFRHGAPPDAIFMFKHALVQDAAYESLPRGRRAQIHKAIVRALEHDPEIGAVQPALLGWHCVQAGLVERAAHYYQLAGQRAEELSALAETKTLLEHGLALVATLPESNERHRLETQLLVALGRVLHITKGMADPEAARVFERAIILARDLDDARTLTKALGGWFINALQRADYAASWRAGSELLTLGLRRNETYPRMLGYVALGTTRLLRGRFQLALNELEQAARVVAAPQKPDDPPQTWGTSPMRSGQVFLAIALACLGRPTQAAVEAANAERATGLTPFGRAAVLTNLCRLNMIMEDIAAFSEHKAALSLLASEQRFPQFEAQSRFYGGWLEVCAGGGCVGVREMRAALAKLGDMNYRMWHAFGCLMLADALVRTANVDEALLVLDEGLGTSAQTGEACLEAELHRRRGELLMRSAHPDPDAAESEMQSAISVARYQSARLFEMRAYVSLTRHGLGRRKPAVSHEGPAWMPAGAALEVLSDGAG
jgi:class 3 adenylate cyclase/predicted ATPase